MLNPNYISQSLAAVSNWTKKNSSASARSSGHTPSRSTHEGSTNDACACGKAQKAKRSEREAMDTRIGLAFGKRILHPGKLKTNMEPENRLLEKGKHLQTHHFLGSVPYWISGVYRILTSVRSWMLPAWSLWPKKIYYIPDRVGGAVQIDSCWKQQLLKFRKEYTWQISLQTCWWVVWDFLAMEIIKFRKKTC